LLGKGNLMAIFNQSKDPGLGEKYYSRTKRVINKDGSFNVKNIGKSFKNLKLYQRLINMHWFKFSCIVLLTYFSVNALFALVYYFAGIEHFTGIPIGTELENYFHLLFFSVQTFTTVGYGAVSPMGISANIIASLEAMMGLLSFALATGLLYGRFSRPSAQILYSEKALIAPYNGGWSFQFRIVNQRNNVMMEMEASLMVVMSDPDSENKYARKYYRMPLEVDFIYFFPLTWTIVHAITEDSPLYGMTPEMLEKREAEFLVLLKGFDDTFDQTLHSRYSYLHNEMEWGARYVRSFHANETGDIVLDVDKVHEYEQVQMPEEVLK